MVVVAKMTNGRIVEIVKVSETVQFSQDKGWVLVCFDFDKVQRKRKEIKWVPSNTRFEWVKEFSFEQG